MSAYEQQSLNRILNQFKLKDYFTNVVGLDNIYASGKTHLAKNLAEMIRSNCSDGKILLIGDTIHDYEVAKEINSDCILISHGHQDEERLLKLGNPVVKNFNALNIHRIILLSVLKKNTCFNVYLRKNFQNIKSFFNRR